MSGFGSHYEPKSFVFIFILRTWLSIVEKMLFEEIEEIGSVVIFWKFNVQKSTPDAHFELHLP